MLRIQSEALSKTPYPHLVQDQVFDPEFYEALKASYPEFGKAEGWSRMSKDLIRGDRAFDEAISAGPWKELYSYFNSSAFIRDMSSLFKGTFNEDELAVSLDDLNLIDYTETREWISARKVSEAIKHFDGNREDVFIRMDFGRGDTGYVRPNHLDWRHRICSILFYFDDPVETGMEGGHFIIHDEPGDDGNIVSKTKPKNNQAIFKVDNNDSYHSVDEITKIDGERKTLYVAISSRGQVW